MSSSRKILVTAALPYANGPIHLGHLVEHIQADIWVRFQKLKGENCLFICGDDAHGTPIMISAEKAGISPEQLIAKIHGEHLQDFQDFYIEFDNFYTTHSPENQELANWVYQRLVEHNDITTRTIQQAYDPIKNMFLPDRYVKGECPRCGAKDQYGDNCEVCGSTYSPTELNNPVSVLSGATPTQKESLHYFFQLDKYEDMLRKWIHSGKLQEHIVNKLTEWFEAGLQQWDISRDAPYFGFEIPDAPGKYFYVWLDAPIGYMASFKNLSSKRAELDFAEYWDKDSTTELYHFVGKDIVYFHALFWPAMLESSGLRKPTSIFTHGFLTVNGLKMSKSRGTFINARDYLNHLNPEYLRYYFAAKLTDRVDDIDLNFDDFSQRINADLVGKVVNIASRCAGFINKQFNNQLASELDDKSRFDKFLKVADEIAKLYDGREYNQLVREVMMLADDVNRYIDEKKPWLLAKQPGQELQVQKICTMGLNLFKIIMTYLKPILPDMAQNVEKFLNIPAMNWKNLHQPLLQHEINTFKPLMQRIDPEQIKAFTKK